MKSASSWFRPQYGKMEPKTINQHYFPRISLLQNVDVSTILMEQHCEGGFVLWDLRGGLWYCVVSDSTFYVATPWELVQKLSAIHYFWHVRDVFDSFGNEPQMWHEVVNQYSTNFVFKDCSMIKKTPFFSKPFCKWIYKTKQKHHSIHPLY